MTTWVMALLEHTLSVVSNKELKRWGDVWASCDACTGWLTLIKLFSYFERTLIKLSLAVFVVIVWLNYTTKTKHREGAVLVFPYFLFQNWCKLRRRLMRLCVRTLTCGDQDCCIDAFADHVLILSLVMHGALLGRFPVPMKGRVCSPLLFLSSWSVSPCIKYTSEFGTVSIYVPCRKSRDQPVLESFFFYIYAVLKS